MSYGIRISKDNVDVTQELTDANAKDFVFASDKNSPKVIYSGFLESSSPFDNVTYTHNLGYIPMFFLFEVDSITSPTFYRSADVAASATTTTITGQLMQYAYLIVLQEGK